MDIVFAKYQALGNSFLVLDGLQEKGRMARFEQLALKMCDPIYGIGADGLMIASQTDSGLAVEVYNADGSWAEKSGNGLRIAAMHLYSNGVISEDKVTLETGSGSSDVAFHRGNRWKRLISASLGKPDFETKNIPVAVPERYYIKRELTVSDRTFIASAVSVGNPHVILFCDHFNFDWEAVGEILEVDGLFPNRTNIGFVVVTDEHNIEVRDWERGVGPTASSGTGAAAAVAIAVMRGFTNRTVDVHTQAGVLQVNWDEKTDELIIKGPVEFICSGVYRQP